MKKIAIFIDNLGIGGIQKSIVNILNTLEDDKYKIDLYLFSDDLFYQEFIPKEVKIIKLKKPPYIYKFLPFNLGFKLYHNNYFKDIPEYDIAIDFDTYQFATADNAIKCPSKKKIMWIHNDILMERKYNFKYRLLSLFMKGKYKYFDTFVGVSEGVIPAFKQLYKLDNKEYVVIPNLIKTEEIFNKCDEDIGDIRIDYNKYNLVSVGRLCHQKGYDLFLNDLKEIISLRKDIHFYLIGDGEDRKKLEKLVNKYKLDKYVTFVGRVSNPFKYENKMDGFVLTSRYEGQGMVLLEAYALGLKIFIPKRIEEYNGYNIKGVDDIKVAIINSKKEVKKRDDLQEYNHKIIAKLNKLLG